MEALAGRDRSQTAPQMLAAPGERRIVGNGEVEAHYPEQRVQEPFGLAQREMVEERRVMAVSMARSEYRRCPPRLPLRLAVQAAIASEDNHTVTSPRRTRTRL